ncbi:NAD-dependent epimerase/dehydratase family protein [Parvibaculum sp.]|uniref:NAD-dependent epimerase/dehydratase family protein n=1 Tax=Parvibaculum sp. TaxID=2024848 RepID=UPI003BA9DD53
MRVLVLGATGLIGSAVVSELVKHGHDVTGLARSDASVAKVEALGAAALRGDITAPRAWASAVGDMDGIVHAAATFDDDMGDTDAALIDAMEDAAREAGVRPRFLYTGGCWLYGATGDEVATEERPFDPPSAFAFMIANAARLLASPYFNAAVLHPATVYAANGGEVADIVEQVKAGGPVEVWGGVETRWPLVHVSDLAAAYRLLLELGELAGHFNVAAEEGVRIQSIIEAACVRFGGACEIALRSVDDVIAENGSWAVGPTLDQQMSSGKLKAACGWVPGNTHFEKSDAFPL